MGSTSGMLAGGDAVCLGASGSEGGLELSGHREPRVRFAACGGIRKGPRHKTSRPRKPCEPLSLTFEDVAVAFTQEELGQLDPAQRTLHQEGILSPSWSCCANWSKGRSHGRWQSPFPKAPAQVTVEKPRS